MRNAWQLFRSDLRRATSNVMAVIVLCGLVVIPSAFTWFNVIGSWEPFQNTKNLKVAVASVDEGYSSPLIPLHINIGDTVISTLRANDQLDWVITSKEDAIAGTTSGDYYAAMVLPKDFSKRMLTFYTAGSKQTEVEYYTNDKSNPLAPLITSEGADDLSAKINEEFTKELSNVALSIVSALVKNLESPEAQSTFVHLEDQLGVVSVQLRATSNTATMFTSLIQSSVPLVKSASNLLGTVENEFTSATGDIQTALGASDDARNALAAASHALTAAFAASAAQLTDFEARLAVLFADLDAHASTSVAGISDMAGQVGQLADRNEALRTSLVNDVQPNVPEEGRPAFDAVIAQLDDAIAQERALESRLNEAATALAAGNADAQQTQAEILGFISSAKTAIANANSAYANNLLPLLDQLAANLAAVGSTLGTIPSQLSGLSGNTGNVVTLLERAASDTAALAKTLTESADSFAHMQEVVTEANATGDFSQIGTIIGSNPETLAAAIAQPIGIDRIPVYPVVSFGAGMAPLYTVLSLWVGALLMAVTLRVEAPRQAFDGGPKLKLDQQFFGRYGIFAVLGLAQSTLVFLGNIFLVGLQPAHPFLFMLSGWLTSLVFTFVIYTLVVSFSDAGKALAVFVLVIQVAGAGGAYPLPLLPQWFQNVSPFLPATHSIDAIRAALAGTYHGDYWIAIGWLLAFIVPALLLALVLRKPLIGLNQMMERQLQSTKLM
ncbi:MAG: YhgE/Pip domain-containing protein [Microbacteriaceae bacterium]|nr:YhgE/Pip domain-containing protein [Microbacteriaceae bacterium]